MNRLKKWELAFLMALCITLLSGLWANREQSQLADKLVRLHVIAVSDDETEQAVKLEVRDAVLEYLTPLLDSCEDSQSAEEVISENLSGIENAALSRSGGRDVTVTLGRENYPTRHYTDFSLPAGEYESLRVVLGEGEGHNWWCVVFPPLCLESALDDGGSAETVLSDSDVALITGENSGYELKFRVLELWGELRDLFS